VLVNVGLHFFYQWRARAPIAASLVVESGLPLQQSYPNWSENDVKQQLHETYSRPRVPEKYTGFREPPFSGRFIHVTEWGYRLSKDQGPWPPDPKHFNVFFLGGSTAFGWGLPDHETVP
jgi:hypothetical protein